jgi:hypothetical protein
MILNFTNELQKIIKHSSDLANEYNLTISGDTSSMPKQHHSVFILFEEDVDKIGAICAAADELDKENRQLKEKFHGTGLEDSHDFYFPLGGGSLF